MPKNKSFRFSFFQYFLATGLLCFLCLDSYCQDFKYRNFTTKDGLPSNTVYSSIQDKEGFMWFATEYGVSRFDGFVFQNYGKQEGLSDDDVFGMFQDSKDRIWFLMSNGTLSYYKNGKIFNKGNDKILIHFDSKSYFNGCVEDGFSNIWFTTYADGVYVLRPNGKIDHLRESLEISSRFIVSSPYLDAKKNVWILGNEGTINLSENPGKTVVQVEKHHFSNEYFFVTKNQELVFTSGKKFFKAKSFSSPFQILDSNQVSYQKVVSKIVEDKSGNIWVSSFSEITKYKNGIFEKQNSTSYLKGKNPSSILFCAQGNVWVTSLNQGIFLVNNQDITHFDFKSNLDPVPVSAINFDGNKIWFGTDNGKIGILKENKIEEFLFPTDGKFFGRGRVKGFLNFPTEKITITASGIGLGYFKNQKLVSILPSGAKTLAYEKKTNSLIIGTGSGLYRLSKAELIAFLDKQGADFEEVKDFLKSNQQESLIPSTRVFKTLIDDYSTIWVATNSGLVSIEYNKVQIWKTVDQRLGVSFQNMALLEDGSLALSSNGLGVYIFRDGIVKIINSKSGLSSDYIRNLRVTGDSLWVCTSKGISLIQSKSGFANFEILTWNKSNGLVSEDIWDILSRKDSLIISSSEGVDIYSKGIINQVFERTVHLKSFFLNGKALPISNEFTIDSLNSSIRLVFFDLDFKNLGLIKYRYRLNKNLAWQEVSGNSIQFYGVNNGFFEIEIQRKIGSGKWSEPILLAKVLIDSGNFWPLFFLILIMASGVLVFSYYQWVQPLLDSKESRQLAFNRYRFESISIFIKRSFSGANFLIGERKNLEALTFISKSKRVFSLIFFGFEDVEHSLFLEEQLVKEYVALNNLEGNSVELDFSTGLINGSENVIIPKMIVFQVIESLIISFPKDSEVLKIEIACSKIGELLQIMISYTVQGHWEFSEESETSFKENINKIRERLAGLIGNKASKMDVVLRSKQQIGKRGIGVQLWLPYKFNAEGS